MICFPLVVVKIHSTTGKGTPAASQVRKTLLPVLFETLTGGKVISGARQCQRQRSKHRHDRSLPESHGLRLKTLINGFCSILANLLDSMR
jgi:hypothetical protein